MAQSTFTKNCRIKLWLYRILDWICLFAPVLVYICIALFSGGVAVLGKVSIVATVIIALVLTVINIIAQKRLRCPIWIILIGLYIAIQQYLMPLIIILAVTSVMDDLLFTPLIHYYYTKLVASKTIDEREEAEQGK